MHETHDESKDEPSFELFLEVLKAEERLSLATKTPQLLKESVVVEPQEGVKVKTSLLS